MNTPNPFLPVLAFARLQQKQTYHLTARYLLSIASLLAGLTAGSASAATISKADNLDALNLGTSWVGGAVPTSGDVAFWDSTVTAANTTATLGADTNYLGLAITSPGATVSINAGNTLTLGASGIDMSAASQGLALACPVNLGTSQTWNVGAGRGLTNSGLITGTGPLVRIGAGTLAINISSNTYSGGTFLGGGTNVIGSVLNSHFSTGSVTLTNGATLVLLSGNSGDPGGGGGGFANNLVIPAGQTGNVFNHWRGTCSGPVTGGGTLNLRVNGTRGEWTANWSGFTGQVNVTTRTGADDFRINVGGTTNVTGFSNCVVNLSNGAVMYQSANPPNGGVTASTTFQPIGALTGSGATLSGNLIAGRSVNWQIGFLNTDTTFSGRIADNTGFTKITKVGTGSLALAGTNSYTGLTTILSGKLVEVTGGSASNSLSTTTFSGATFGVLLSPNGNQWVGTNLIFASGSGLEMNLAGSSPSTTIAPLLVRGNLSLTSSVSVKIVGGNWAVGAYPLIKYTGSLLGNGFGALALGTLPARVTGVLSNDTANSSIDFIVTATTEPLHYASGTGGVWDTNSTFIWQDAANTFVAYTEVNGLGDSVLLDDRATGASPLTVILNTNVVPISVTVNSTKNYTLSGTGNVGGIASLTKAGTSTFTLATTNSFTGGVNANGGILSFSTLGNLGNSPIIFGGGTVQWGLGNTTDISVRTVTFNAGGATIDTAGNNIVFANPVGNNGAGGLTKTGAGTLTLSGVNRYSGTTTVNQASLVLAAGASISNSVAIKVNGGAILDVTASGLALNGAVSQTLSGTGTVNGNVTAGAGSSIQPGTSPGTITFANGVTMSGGTLVMDVSTNAGGTDLIHVTGLLTLNSGNLQLVPATVLTNGAYKLFETPGGFAGTPGNLVVLGFSQPGQIAFLSDAVAGEIDLIVATGGTNSLVWSGTGSLWDVGATADWLAGGNPSVFNQGDGVTFDDTGAASPAASLMAAIYPSNVTVSAAASYTLQDGNGAGKLIGPTRINKSGAGTLTLLMANNNSGPTVINGGALQLGNGGITGMVGNGNITNNGSVVFFQPDDRNVNGIITGTGSVVQQGTAVLTLTKDNSYSGATTISSGTLQVGNGGATGTLGSGPVTNAGTLIFNRSGTFTVANGIKGTGTPNPASLTQVGPGTMTLGGVNTYEGNTVISNGVIKLGASEVIPDGGATTGWLILDGGVSSAGTLDLNGFNETVNALSGVAGTVRGTILNSVALATNTLTVNSIANTAYAGIIQDNGGSGGAVAVVKDGASTLTFTGPNSYSGGTIIKAGTMAVGSGGSFGAGGIVMSNATTLNMTANNPSVFPGNSITTAAGGSATFLSANGANGLAGNFISGDSSSTNIIAGPISCSTANVKQFQAFTGTVVIQDGFSLRFSSTTLSVNGGDNTTFIVGNASTLNTRNGTGVAAGNGVYLGALFGSGGTLGGAGNADGTSIYVIGGKGVDCTFGGTIAGTAPRSTFITKVGAATLTLDGTLSYEGSTTVSNGVLALASGATFDTSTNIIVRSGASLFLDPAGTTAGTLNLGNVVAQTLSGGGTIRGSVNATANSTIAPGDGISTLTVTNAVTLAGTVNMELNRTNAPATNDMIAAVSVAAGGTLNVTNLGPTLFTGDKFRLFSVPVSGAFGTVNLPAMNAAGTISYTWANNLAIDGTIQVLSGFSVAPTNITAVLSGNTLTLAWPADHTGWTLQTNSVGLLSPSWFPYPGSTATNQIIMTIDPTKPSVFYRLVY